jgi:hypothetical protein
MAYSIVLLEYGQNLGSRLLGRSIIKELSTNLYNSDLIVLDFSNVRFMSVSFATEIFPSLVNDYQIKEIEIYNASDFIKRQIDFTIKSMTKNESKFRFSTERNKKGN